MENQVEIPIYDVEFDEMQTEGISMISFVNKPAIKRDFIALSEITNKLEVKFTNIDKYKMQAEGAILVPNEPILRIDEKTGKVFYIVFSESVVEKIYNNFMKKKATDQTNLEHDQTVKLSGNYIIESYIIRPELQNINLKLPIGSAVAKFQITDEIFFREQILTGKVKGFSLEGEFNFTEKFTDKLQEKKSKSEFELLKEVLYL